MTLSNTFSKSFSIFLKNRIYDFNGTFFEESNIIIILVPVVSIFLKNVIHIWLRSNFIN